MSTIDLLLANRTKRKPSSLKMQEMAERSAAGDLTSFSGVFSQVELTELQKNSIEALLKSYAAEKANIAADYHMLLSLTGEIKAIDNQALLLHGERIAKAQNILMPYKEGAFTAWLKVAYGNRQTPYNFLHYYFFHEQISKELKARLSLMPRQAVYTLASREGPIKQKEAFIANYAGETKEELLKAIRRTFPLVEKDKRARDVTAQLIKTFEKITLEVQEHILQLSPADKEKLRQAVSKIQHLLN